MDMQMVSLRPHLRFALGILLSFALCTCAPIPPVTHHAANKPKPQYEADAFVTQLSLAKLALAKDKTDTSAAASRLAVIQAYAAQKHRKSAPQPVVILSYTVQGKQGLQQLAAPFDLPVESANFPALLEIVNALSATPYTLHDVHPAFVSVVPVKSLDAMDGDSEGTKIVLDRQLQSMLHRPVPLMPLDEARVQLQLSHFFANHHVRDAAYLSVENGKQVLAEVAQDATGNSSGTENLSRQLEAMEDQLHRTMPFAIGTF